MINEDLYGGYLRNLTMGMQDNEDRTQPRAFLLAVRNFVNGALESKLCDDAEHYAAMVDALEDFAHSEYNRIETSYKMFVEICNVDEYGLPVAKASPPNINPMPQQFYGSSMSKLIEEAEQAATESQIADAKSEGNPICGESNQPYEEEKEPEYVSIPMAADDFSYIAKRLKEIETE